jgi:hypothetical protein
MAPVTAKALAAAVLATAKVPALITFPVTQMDLATVQVQVPVRVRVTVNFAVMPLVAVLMETLMTFKY